MECGATFGHETATLLRTLYRARANCAKAVVTACWRQTESHTALGNTTGPSETVSRNSRICVKIR